MLRFNDENLLQNQQAKIFINNIVKLNNEITIEE